MAVYRKMNAPNIELWIRSKELIAKSRNLNHALSIISLHGENKAFVIAFHPLKILKGDV